MPTVASERGDEPAGRASSEGDVHPRRAPGGTNSVDLVAADEAATSFGVAASSAGLGLPYTRLRAPDYCEKEPAVRSWAYVE